ncbi:MAG: restriction endonuclease subunit S [Methanosphaera sp.]|nr:restriction endonuclease subunit S [Methanosphaera sp.]
MNFKNGQMIPLKDLTNRVKVGFVGSCNNDYCNSDEGYPMIRTTNLTNSGINLSNLKYVTKEFYEKYEKSQLHYGDILIARHGNNGLASLWTENFKAQCLNVVIVETNDEIADKYFLYYMINSIHVQKQLKAMVGGSVQGVVNTKDIADVLIPYYDLDTQRRLVDTLRKIDQKIELNTKINNNLLELSNIIFLNKFKDFNKYKEEDLKYTEIGFIPHNWDLLSLKEISDVAIGKTPPRKEQEWFSTNQNDIKWVSIKDLGNSGTFIFETSEYLTEEAIDKFNVKMIPKNTVLLSFKLTVGRIAITTENMVTNEAIAHFILNEDNNISKEYLYLYLKNFNFESLGSTSSIAKAINSKIVKEIPVIIPNKNDIQEFNLIVQPIFETIYKNQLEINKLTNLRDTLLPKLMSGEIDVSEINFDLE